MRQARSPHIPCCPESSREDSRATSLSGRRWDKAGESSIFLLWPARCGWAQWRPWEALPLEEQSALF